MRLMSFALTVAQVRARTKTVTRRLGWRTLQPGARLRAVRQCMGLRRGEQVQDLAVLEVVSVRREPLHAIDAADCAAEGFPELAPAAFIALFCGAHRCAPDTEVTRIQFTYVEPT